MQNSFHRVKKRGGTFLFYFTFWHVADADSRYGLFSITDKVTLFADDFLFLER